jgi:hypothetical protein
VSLLDEDTSVVDRLGETELVDTSLEAALEKVLDLEGKNVIQSHAGLVEDTDTYETTDQGVTLEETLGVLLVQGKKVTNAGMSFPPFSQLKDVSLEHTERHDESWRG